MIYMSTESTRTFWEKVKAGWMKFARKIGEFNSKVVLGLLFILVIGVYAILKRLISFFIRKKNDQSYWIEKSWEQPTLETFKRQF